MLELTLVGDGILISRLPEILARPGVAITVVGPASSALARSRHVDRHIAVVPAGEDASWEEELLNDSALLAHLDADYVVFGGDNVSVPLARGGLPDSRKLELLPVRAVAGLATVGSKVGLALLATELGLCFPRTLVATSREQLAIAAKSFTGPYLIKADRGGAGLGVRLVQPGQAQPFDDIPDAWYPVIVQENIVGPAASAEVLFKNGELLGWIYAHALACSSPFGPSTSRRYLSPPSLDFEADISALGRSAGLHGFYNCSFIWSAAEGRHYIFEADPRPNAWHQFGPRLGVDWSALMLANADPSTIASPKLGSRTPKIHLFPRSLVSAIDNGSWRQAAPWALSFRGTWFTRNWRDRSVNAAEWKLVRDAVRRKSASIAIASWMRLPARARRALNAIGAKTALKTLVQAW